MPLHEEGGKRRLCSRPLEADVALESNRHNLEYLRIPSKQFWEPLGDPTCSKGNNSGLQEFCPFNFHLGVPNGVCISECLSLFSGIHAMWYVLDTSNLGVYLHRNFLQSSRKTGRKLAISNLFPDESVKKDHA